MEGMRERGGGREGGGGGRLLGFLGGGQSAAKQVTVLEAPLSVSLVYCVYKHPDLMSVCV